MVNWEKYRELYPVVNNQTYFMTAGGGALSTLVLRAITDRYAIVATNGGKVFGDNIKIMETCREKIAKLVNADKDDIAFIPNVSFGMNALAHSLKNEDFVLLAKNDFGSSVLPWKNAGHSISWASDSADLIDKLKSSRQTENISSIVASYVHYGNGYKIPLDCFKNIKQNANLIINGTQGIGVFPIDVKKQEIDALVCSCYKWMGCGEGIAFMYINPNFFKKLTPALVGWRSVERAMNFDADCQLFQSAKIFELGWDNMTIFAGLDAALDLISEIGIKNITQQVVLLTDYLVDGLKKLKIPIFSNLDALYRSGIILLGPFKQLDLIVEILTSHNIWITQRDGGIRISLHYYNNKTDIDHLLDALGLILKTNQSIS